MLSKSLKSCKSALSLITQIKKTLYNFNDVSNLTEEQQQIQKIAFDFAEKKIAPFAADWDRQSKFPRETYKELADLGFGGIYCKPEHGGSGLGRIEASLIIEALATACVTTAAYLSIHNMNCWIIDEFGNEAQKKKYLPSLTTCEEFSSYCLTEPDAGSDAFSIKTSAKKDGSDYILNGSKIFISGGGLSKVYVVMAKTSPKQISTFIVENNTKGLSFGKTEHKLGWKNSPTTVVNFDDLRIPQENLISKEGEGFKIAMKALDGGRINIASASLGGASFCLNSAKDHIKTRKQFGKTLANNQYLAFKLADMSTDLSASRIMVRNAARLIDINHPDKTMYCAMTKQLVTDKCFNVANDALQMYGGYGYLNEYPIERYVRDMRVNQILEGTNEIMRLIVSRSVLKDD